DIRSDKVRKALEGCIKEFYEKQEICDPSYIRDLSQAFMDLGAMICIPNGKARCEDCPLNERCGAFHLGLQEQIPFKSKPKARRIVKRTLFIIRNGDTFLLRKRPDKGLLAGLYEFKGIDEQLDREQVNELLNKEGYDPLRMKKLPEARHVFSHIEWHLDAYEIQIGNWDVPLKEDEVLVDKEELRKLAIPSAFRTYIDYYGLREERERV
ncbi:MAG: NUDIX domain-containing protein, partial [Erysipelotrichaceae bacterium]|nr:NUDIX domain-containing protein [Erysipelotrichaceae bacterium]